MAAANHKLAVIIKCPLDKEEFLLIKQTPPLKFNDPEYDSFVDSDLWDLPSTELTPLPDLDQLLHSQIPIKTHESSSSDKLNLSQFDLNSALNKFIFFFTGIGASRIWYSQGGRVGILEVHRGT